MRHNCIPISTGTSVSHILIDKPEKFHIVSCLLLSWFLLMADDVFSHKSVRVKHSSFSSEHVFPKL